MTLTTRKQAIYKGKRFYDGKPCARCGMTKRHISGNCFYCQKYYNEKYKNKVNVGLCLSDESYEAFLELVEACCDDCEKIEISREMQNAIIEISKEIEIWNDLKSLVIRMAKEQVKCDFTKDDVVFDDSTYWDFLAFFNREVKRLFPEARIGKIWDNMTEQEKDEYLEEYNDRQT